MTWEGKSWKCPELGNKEKLRLTWVGNGEIVPLRLRMTWQGKRLTMSSSGNHNPYFKRLKMTWGGKHKLTMPWGGKSKIENNLMGVENALGAEFVKMHSPPKRTLSDQRFRDFLKASMIHLSLRRFCSRCFFFLTFENTQEHKWAQYVRYR